MMDLKAVFMVLAALGFAIPVEAGIVSNAVREAVEFAAKKFGKEVAEEGVEKLTSRVASLAAKHGDDVVTAAFRKVGPRAGRLVSEAGENGDVVLRLLARHGDDGASLAMRPGALRMISRYGDDGAEALLRHGAVGEQVIGQFAEGGVKALTKVTPQSGRRLAMLAGDGILKPELIDVVSRYGDRACEFVWKNKAALAVGATLIAFTTNPEPFLDGTVQLTGVVADSAVKPLVHEAGKHFGGILITIALLLIAAVIVLIEWGKRSRSPVWRASGLLIREACGRFFWNRWKK